MDTWQDALKNAVWERNMAEHAFLQSDPDSCDYHIYQLHAAEEKVRMVLLQAKKAMGYASTTPCPLSSADHRALASGSYNPKLDGEE